MKKFILTILLLSMLAGIYAENYSIPKSVAMSALVPGLGQFNCDENKKGSLFLASDIAVILSYFRLEKEIDWKIKSYKDYAVNYAGAKPGQSNNYYIDVEDYRSMEEYNNEIILQARNYYEAMLGNEDVVFTEEDMNNYINERIYTEDENWEWNSTSKHTKYRELFDDKHKLQLYSKIAFSAIFLNRIISMIDAGRTAYKKNKFIENSSLSIQPDYKEKGLFLTYEYKF